jgi:hypothetical protein
MKKHILLYISVLTLGINFSCQEGFLDQVPDDRLSLDLTFAHKKTAEQYLANVYAHIPDEFAQRFVGGTFGEGYVNSGPWTGGSDEAEYDWTFVQSQNVNIGAWGPTTGFVGTLWSNFYKGIRSASDFIANIDKCPDCGEQTIAQYKAEARALRAIYYYYLMRAYGPVVLTGETSLAPDAASITSIPRSSFDECVDYVVSELAQAALDLPAKPITNDGYGRITKGFALAIKSKILLHAASPLFNGNTDYADMVNNDGKQLINQQYDANKWKKAADAMKAFIDEFVPTTYDLFKKNDGSGVFSPYLSCRDVMLTDWNQEIIFARVAASVSYSQYERTPYHSGSSSDVRGSGGLGVTQSMVDAYFTDNGRSIDDPASNYVASGFSSFKAPYDEQSRNTYNQWVNREPRFYVGVTYDGSVWLVKSNNTLVVTRTWYNGNSGRAIGGNDFTPTGYVVRKNMNLGNWNVNNRTLVVLRLAEVFLDYAEALNEYDPGNADILTYLNLIRERAGIPQYNDVDLPIPSSQAAMREAIRKERRVELAFENVRYFDVRRWKIAEETDNGPAYGLDINDPKEANFYNVVPFETRVFQKKHYLFPIPQDEINRDKELVQNSGW